MEEYVVRRRNRLKKHFVNTSNVLLYGYGSLSDAAKITYQVIDSFDWADADDGTSKGYAYPSIRRIGSAMVRVAGTTTSRPASRRYRSMKTRARNCCTSVWLTPIRTTRTT